jgi:hypothetical protein
MSYFVIRRADCLPVLEIHSSKAAAKINRNAFAVFTALQWLGAFNRAVSWGSAAPERDALAILERAGVVA